jgi:hypothetical protein
MSKARNVFSRSTVQPSISMWASLYVDPTGAAVGWMVSTWSERDVMPTLEPKMHWVSHEDGKFYRMLLEIPSSIKIFDEDTEIEPHRAVFVRTTLKNWEQEYTDGVR